MDALLWSFWAAIAVGYVSMLAITTGAERHFSENPDRRVPGCSTVTIVVKGAAGAARVERSR